MSQFSFPFDATETSPGVFDREYSAGQFAQFFATLFGSGVMPGANTLKVYLSDTRTLAIESGRALLDGVYFAYDDEEGLAVQTFVAPNADATLLRIDRIIARLDRRINARSVVFAYLQGEPSATPSAPALTQGEDVFEISLARINIQPNTTIISSNDVIDERDDDSVCGRVDSLVSNIPVLTADRAVITDGTGKLIVSAITVAELGYLSGLTGNIKTALDNKQAAFTLTGDRVVISNAQGAPISSEVTAAQLVTMKNIATGAQKITAVYA